MEVRYIDYAGSLKRCADFGTISNTNVGQQYIVRTGDRFYRNYQQQKCSMFIKYAEGKPIGFAQCQIRYDYVEGTETSLVGYLEGIFIQEQFRHKGFARELLQECEKWARSKKCSEFSSDCEINNTDSFKFHLAMGFDEVNRIICFKKEI